MDDRLIVFYYAMRLINECILPIITGSHNATLVFPEDRAEQSNLCTGNRKHLYRNVGRHQCCPGDILLREKDCRKLLSSSTIIACLHQTPRMELEMVRFYCTTKILLELPDFLYIIAAVIIRTTLAY